MHISAQNLRFAAHRTFEYGSAAMLSSEPNCTILEKSYSLRQDV